MFIRYYYPKAEGLARKLAGTVTEGTQF